MPLKAPPKLPCPKCGQPDTRWLEFTSTLNGTDTFQCLACGTVWAVRTPGPAAACREGTRTDNVDVLRETLGMLRRYAVRLVQTRGGARERAHALLSARPQDWLVAVLVADNQARYLAANSAARVLTGYTERDLCQRSVWDLTPEMTIAAGQRLWARFRADGAFDGRYRLLTQSGNVITVECVAAANMLRGLHVSALTTRRMLRTLMLPTSPTPSLLTPLRP